MARNSSTSTDIRACPVSIFNDTELTTLRARLASGGCDSPLASTSPFTGGDSEGDGARAGAILCLSLLVDPVVCMGGYFVLFEAWCLRNELTASVIEETQGQALIEQRGHLVVGDRAIAVSIWIIFPSCSATVTEFHQTRVCGCQRQERAGSGCLSVRI
jgi:hypothetical protein